MLRLVALVRTDVSEELSACIMRVTKIGSVLRLLVTANVVQPGDGGHAFSKNVDSDKSHTA
jgi:hypothetical protein